MVSLKAFYIIALPRTSLKVFGFLRSLLQFCNFLKLDLFKILFFQNAASLAVAEKYVSAFQELARTNNTLILPANTGDVSSMVAQVKIARSFDLHEMLKDSIF
jgi:hypothetical protein